jgi:cell division protein FtsW
VKLAVTVLVFCVAALLALGMVMLYSSSMVQVGSRYLVMQMIWCVLGLVSAVTIAFVDYRFLKRIWWILLGLALVLLVLVLVPHIGVVRGHARRWFSLGPASFQPSEFAKVAVLIALAWYGERYRRQMPNWKTGIVIPGVVIVVAAGLIFKEPDVGNALLLASVCGIVLLIAGIRLRYFLPPVLIAATGVAVFIAHNPMRSDRIYSWLHVEETKQDKGMQAYQAMVALGSGGVTGKGLGDGRQKLGFVPEHHTDFIFSIIGEELGLVATMLVVAAFVAFVISGLFISVNAADTFGLLLGSGITFLIGLQAFINIGVVTSALPNKGLPLPFISYGGSNLLVMLTCVGILLSIARHARLSDSKANRSTDPEESSLFRPQRNPFKHPRYST